jgi:rhomboid protease GluP
MSETLSLNLDPHPSAEADDQSPAPRAPAGPTPFVTVGMIAANVLVFLVMVVCGVPFLSPNGQQVLPWGADFGPLTTSGQWWRLLTACFLHFGIIHLVMNMFCLLQVGVYTERLFGSVRYLLVYLLAGIGGNIAGLYFHPLTVSAGASGAIFGVYGGLLGFMAIYHRAVPRENLLKIGKSAAIFLGYNLIYGLASATTDLTAHVAGLLTGFGAGCLLAQPISTAGRGVRLVRPIGVALIVGLAGFAAIKHVPKSSASQAELFRQIAMGSSVTVGNNDKVLYSGIATKADAEAVAQMLVRLGLFKKPNVVILFHKEPGAASISISFDADESQYKVDPKLPPMVDNVTSKLVDGKTVIVHSMEKRAPLKRGPLPWDDPAILESLRTISPQLAYAAGGPPLTIRLLDGVGDVRNEVKFDASEVLVGSLDAVTYSGEATAQQARALGSALEASGFFKDRGATVNLVNNGDGPEVSFYLRDGASGNPQMGAAFAVIGKKIAPAVGGPPLTVHLVDNSRQATKDIEIR